MQTIPATMRSLLKTKQIYGVNAPMASLTVTADVIDEAVTFPGTTAAVSMVHQSWTTAALAVRDTPGSSYSVTYSSGTDFTYDTTAGTIARIAGSAIASTGKVYVDYQHSVAIRASKLTVAWEQAALAQRFSAEIPNVSSSSPNSEGWFSPDRGDDTSIFSKNNHYNALLPGRTVKIVMGYTTSTGNHVQVMQGQIDTVQESIAPGRTTIRIEGRDDGWRIIDRAVGNNSTGYDKTFTSILVSCAVNSLLSDAGFSTSQRTVAATPQTITSKIFQKVPIADALEWCQEKSGYELTIDRNGNADFHYPTDRQPAVTNEVVSLATTAAVTLTTGPLVTNSEVVTSTDGLTTYVRGTTTPSGDYVMDFKNQTIARHSTGTIPAGNILIDYVYAAWTYQQGQDLFRLDYSISRQDVFGSIYVSGASSATSTGVYLYTGAGGGGGSSYGVDAVKTLFVEMPEITLTTGSTQLQDAANQLGNDMVRRVREASFEGVGVPWLDVGDCLRFIEYRSTISEIYRVISLEHECSTGGLRTRGRAYHYGYSPI